MIPKHRQFKEINPDKPHYMIGNKFAVKPAEQQRNQIITVYVTADEKRECEKAASKRKMKPSTWARIHLIQFAKDIISCPDKLSGGAS